MTLALSQLLASVELTFESESAVEIALALSTSCPVQEAPCRRWYGCANAVVQSARGILVMLAGRAEKHFAVIPIFCAAWAVTRVLRQANGRLANSAQDWRRGRIPPATPVTANMYCGSESDHRPSEAERRLAESEERFRQLTALSSDWQWEQDAQFRFVSVSHRHLENIGIEEGDFVGRTRWEVGALNLSAEDWARHRAKLERHEPFRNLVVRHPDRNGRETWLSINGDPFFDTEGRFQGYRGTRYSRHRNCCHFLLKVLAGSGSWSKLLPSGVRDK